MRDRRALVVAAITLWAAELALCALTSEAPTAREAGISAVAHVAAACLALLPRSVPLQLAMAWAPTLLITASIAIPHVIWGGVSPAWLLVPGLVAYIALSAGDLVPSVPRVLACVAGAAAVGGVTLPASVQAPGDGPDVVIVTVDTLRADAARDMQAYRALAARGTTFTAQAPAPWTLPSVASVLTGTDDHGAGKTTVVRGIRADVPTLAERFRDRGYHTAAVVAGNPFTSRTTGLDRGFAHFEHPRETYPRANPRGRTPGKRARPLASRWLPGPLHDADHIVGRGITLLDEVDGPVFLWLHLMDCHLPYWHVDETSLSAARKAVLSGPATRDAIRADPSFTADELRIAYDHEVARVDAALAPLVARDAIVVLTADHGEEFFDHGGFEHGHTLFQELLDVPLVIGGLQGSPGVVGLRDIGPLLLGEPLSTAPLASGDLYFPSSHRAALREGSRKWVKHEDRTVVYDLDTDPTEAHPMPASRSLAPSLADGPPAAPSTDSLRSLGYVDP